MANGQVDIAVLLATFTDLYKNYIPNGPQKGLSGMLCFSLSVLYSNYNQVVHNIWP